MQLAHARRRPRSPRARGRLVSLPTGAPRPRRCRRRQLRAAQPIPDGPPRRQGLPRGRVRALRRAGRCEARCAAERALRAPLRLGRHRGRGCGAQAQPRRGVLPHSGRGVRGALAPEGAPVRQPPPHRPPGRLRGGPPPVPRVPLPGTRQVRGIRRHILLQRLPLVPRRVRRGRVLPRVHGRVGGAARGVHTHGLGQLRRGEGPGRDRRIRRLRREEHH
mmetsp:Transcript_6557/g.23107  ORF Transcript_6557/g.23107 Transcript_6557/m.23107 type:complete len:219 (-) Transcript_6557:1518-2174(-)